MCIPSIDKDTHGFDGQKNVHTSSKTLKIHKVFPAAFSSSDRFSASAKLLAPDSDGFSSDFWLLRRRCVVTHQDEKDKKRRKDALSGVSALVNRYYILFKKSSASFRLLKIMTCFSVPYFSINSYSLGKESLAKSLIYVSNSGSNSFSIHGIS